MTEPTVEGIEAALERATELETAAALDALRSARRDLERLREDPSVPDERRRELEDRVDQRLREISRREEYDGGMGAAMNPDEDDAP